MFDFKNFPAILRFQDKYEDAPLYEVEVFGYLDLPRKLVVFRRNCYWVQTEIGDIDFLPLDEFENQMNKFSLVE